MVLELPIEQAGLPVGPGDADQHGVVERSHSGSKPVVQWFDGP